MKYRMRVTVAALGIASVAGLVAACGGSSGTATTTGGANPGGTNGLQAYASCLSRNGVTIALPSGRPGGFPTGVRPSGIRPSGGPGGGFPGGGGFFQKPANVDDATWQKAQNACASLRPSFGPRGGNGGNGADAAFRNCLANHGVTASAGPGPLPTADPKVAAAVKACAVLRPTAAPAATG